MTTEIVDTSRNGLGHKVTKVRESLTKGQGHKVVAEVRVGSSVQHGYATLTVATDDSEVMRLLAELKDRLHVVATDMAATIMGAPR